MKLISTQIALFTKDLIERPDLVMNNINEGLNGIMDSMPNIQNLPIDLLDIPLAQINSKDNKFALNVARNRVDLFVNSDFHDDKTPNESFKLNEDIIKKYCKTVKNNNDILRVGVIFTLFKLTAENVQEIYQKYIKIPYCVNDTEIGIRSNKQTLIKKKVYNNILNVNAGNLHINNDNGSAEDYKGVIFQLDFNNNPNDDVLTIEEIYDILSNAMSKLTPKALKELI